jgi:hypothetical protein
MNEQVGHREDWFYISFADPHRPKGTQFLGGCYVRAVADDPELEAKAMLFAAERRGDGTTLDDEELGVAMALATATRLGINPGGEARVLGPLPEAQLDAAVPPEDRERLLTREQIEGE